MLGATVYRRAPGVTLHGWTLVEDDRSVEAAAEAADVPVEQAERFARMMAESEHKRTQPPYPTIPR